MPLGGITNLDYTVLLRRNLPETRAFYRDVMQFPIETDPPNWVSFRIGDDGPAHPAIDTCHAELLAHGVPIVRHPWLLSASL